MYMYMYMYSTKYIHIVQNDNWDIGQFTQELDISFIQKFIFKVAVKLVMLVEK